MMRLKKMLMVFFVIAFLQTNVSAMTTNGDQILNSNGQPIELHGVNWFGFNNGQTMVDGLWSGSGAIAGDFATVVYRMQLLGFNAVRLPFSFKDIYNLSPVGFAGPCQIPTTSQIQASVTNPLIAVVGKTIPAMIAPPPRIEGQCDNYFPNDTTLNRFLWTVNFFAKNGFYVLIDNHLREDQTVLENKAKWVQQWTDLVTKISQDPISKKMLMIDILNEPDEYGIQWEASSSRPGLQELYTLVMDAVYPINPEALFFIEGTGQGNIGANWGDGFATSQSGMSNPSAFFNALFTKPYLNQVVISPHVYPPSVTGATQNFSGPGLNARLSESFGYLTKTGYCNGTICKTFPVAIGEFGSRFETPNDITSMQDIAKYLNNTGTGADGKHNAIKNWFYWSWNANSSDTGGIVADDWLTIIWKKIDYLATIGLKPWYSQAVNPVKTGSLCISVQSVDGLNPSDLKPIVINNQSFAFTDLNQTVCQTLPVGSYTVTAPTLTTATMKFTANPQTITVTDGGTTTVTIAYVGVPIIVPAKTGKACITIKSVTGLTKTDLKSIVINNQTYAFTDFNIAVCNTLPFGTYTVTAPTLTTPTMKFTASPQTITVTEGGTANVSITYVGTPIVTPVKQGKVCVTIKPVTGLAKSDLKSVVISNQTYAFTDFNVAVCNTLPVGTYTVTAPTLTTATMKFTASPQTITVTDGGTANVSITYVGTPIVVPSQDITATVQVGPGWQENPGSGIYMNTINVYVKNNSSVKIATPWTIAVTNSSYKSVTSFWNVVYKSIQNGQINGTVVEGWQALLPNGQNAVNFGMVITSSSSNFIPTSILINGKPVAITIAP